MENVIKQISNVLENNNIKYYIEYDEDEINILYEKSD